MGKIIKWKIPVKQRKEVLDEDDKEVKNNGNKAKKRNEKEEKESKKKRLIYRQGRGRKRSRTR